MKIEAVRVGQTYQNKKTELFYRVAAVERDRLFGGGTIVLTLLSKVRENHRKIFIDSLNENFEYIAAHDEMLCQKVWEQEYIAPIIHRIETNKNHHYKTFKDDKITYKGKIISGDKDNYYDELHSFIGCEVILRDYYLDGSIVDQSIELESIYLNDSGRQGIKFISRREK